MRLWLKKRDVKLIVPPVRAEQIVTSPGSFEAQKIIKDQYAGQNVQIRYVVPAK